MKDKISDAKTFGPGMWYTIHVTAIKMGQDTFLSWIYIIINSIPCLDCRQHAVVYLSEDPPSGYKDVYTTDGEPIGMFKWSWKFHNSVNQRLNKPIIDFDTAYKMYTDESVLCSEGCGN